MILTTTSPSSPLASEGGHWYLADGTPYYSIVGTNGKERDVTLRDARKVGALPSVTKVIREAAAPGLERWKLRQLALAILTLPRLHDESEDAFLARAEKDAQEQGKKAAERGTQIHAAIEQHYAGTYIGDLWTPWIIEVAGVLDKHCGPRKWAPEKSFAHPLGFGGKVDLHCADWVLDIKTKDDDKSDIYDEHAMQLAAYRHGLGLVGHSNARCGIVFVNRNEPRAQFVEVSEDKLARGWAMFEALLRYWKAKTGYLL